MLVVALVSCLSGCGGDGIGLSTGQGTDPVVLDVPIAYVKRPVPLDNQGNVETLDARELITFDIGADLYVRDRASPSAPELNITGAITQGLGAVRDLEASYDGERVLFAMRFPFDPNAQEEDLPRWNIWQYDFGTGQLTRIIASDITAELGHDVAPHYLPDGRIIFSSTRQRQSNTILLDEGKPQFSALVEDRNEMAFVLHVMNDDGSGIHQVSFNQSHDMDPTVLSDGRVAFTRWDGAGPRSELNLFAMNPDGTELRLLYGAESHGTGTGGANVHFFQPREMPDGNVMAIIRQSVVDDFGGDIVTIDVPNYIENAQPTIPNQGVLTGPAQAAAVINDVRTDGTISPGGEFNSVFPLWDGTDRMFVSWSQCRLVDAVTLLPVPCTPAGLADPNAVQAFPLYGIWLYDRTNNTQLPVVVPEENFMITEIVAGQPRTLPPVILDKAVTGALDPNLMAEGAGLLNIRSVYDLDGVDTAVPDIPTLADPGLTTAASLRPARFLRIVKAVSIPDDDVRVIRDSSFGAGGPGNGMREIIGYLPIEPDGSVIAKVPANVALAISVLDERGRRITPRHHNWIQVLPGDELGCNGCHQNGNGLSHGRTDAFTSAYAGALTTGLPFPNTLPAIFADFGETMAEARARISCASGNCDAIIPSVDIHYADVWTDPAPTAANRAPDLPFDYLYADLTTPEPVSAACQATWVAAGPGACRTIIHYESIIHPLWSVPRLAADGITDRTCTTCHTTNSDTQLAEGQLELTDGQSDQQADHFHAYQELLVGDNLETLDLGTGLVVDDQQQIGTDPVTGLPLFAPIPIGSPMSANGANASGQFFDRFEDGTNVIHDGLMIDAELRLISEWLDIGGQYYNNPFDAPLN